MQRVQTRVEDWEEEEDARVHLPLDSWKRRLLVYHGKSQTLTWVSFPEAKKLYDPVVVGRLTGFETVGVRSIKDEYEYVLWTTDLDVISILNPPNDSWF